MKRNVDKKLGCLSRSRNEWDGRLLKWDILLMEVNEISRDFFSWQKKSNQILIFLALPALNRS